MAINQNSYLQRIAARVRPTEELLTTEKMATANLQRTPEGLAETLSEAWYTLKRKLGETLERDYYSEDSIIANFTPEIIVQEGYYARYSSVSSIADSVKVAVSNIATEITLSKVGYDPPILIEACDFITASGDCIKSMESAVREYSGQNINAKNPGTLIQATLPVAEALSKCKERRPYGMLFRQYGQDYDKKVLREFKTVPYKIAIAVLFVKQDGSAL